MPRSIENKVNTTIHIPKLRHPLISFQDMADEVGEQETQEASCLLTVGFTERCWRDGCLLDCLIGYP